MEEYRQKIELLMLRARIREEPRKTIARFQSDLNLEIRDRIGIIPFVDFNDLVH